MRPIPMLLSLVLTTLPLVGMEDSDTGLIPKAQRQDVSAFGFTDGKGQRTVAEFKGKALVVDCWTTWCGPCRRSLPELAFIQRQEAKLPVAVIPINLDEEGWAVVTPFLIQNRQALPNFRAFMAGTGKHGLSVLGEVKSYPTTFLVDADGRLAWRWSGYGEGLVIERLNQLLRELPPPAKP